VGRRHWNRGMTTTISQCGAHSHRVLSGATRHLSMSSRPRERIDTPPRNFIPTGGAKRLAASICHPDRRSEATRRLNMSSRPEERSDGVEGSMGRLMEARSRKSPCRLVLSEVDGRVEWIPPLARSARSVGMTWWGRVGVDRASNIEHRVAGIRRGYSPDTAWRRSTRPCLRQLARPSW